MREETLVELVYGLTTNNTLLSFGSNTPATVSALVVITSTNGGETIIDIDYFALNQQLYDIGASGTLYSINCATGAATVDVANAAVGTAVSIDFNPMANRLRIISADPANLGNANQNYRLTPSTGGATAAGMVTADGMLAYAAGAPRAGAVPNLIGSAYTGNVNGAAATATILYSIDNPNPSGQCFLVQHINGPAFSTLQTVAGLSIPAFGLTAFDPVTNTGFDISGDTGLACVSEDLGTNGERLFTLNLTNGVLTRWVPTWAKSAPRTGSRASRCSRCSSRAHGRCARWGWRVPGGRHAAGVRR